MTRTDADDLAKRIINCWRGGPPLVEWIDTLMPLNAGAAGTAFIRLRTQLDAAPSIKRYLDEYRMLDVDDASTRKPPCEECDDTGWVQTPPVVNRDHLYSGMRPCPRCPEGQAREDSRVWSSAKRRPYASESEADLVLANERARGRAKLRPIEDVRR